MKKNYYVNVYSITRHYGGPEEGGTWYNILDCIASVPVKGRKAARKEIKRLKKIYGKGRGNIYSVLGGTLIQYSIEDTYAQSQTREAYRYE